MFTNGFGWPHLLIILVVVIILFGAKRLPDAARGVGKSLRIFKSEAKAMREEHQQDDSANEQSQGTQPSQLPQSSSSGGTNSTSANGAQPAEKQKDDVQS